ncbi:MAG: hypothetical protein Q9210_005006 [Variospora velana]
MDDALPVALLTPYFVPQPGLLHRFRRKRAEPLIIPTITETRPQSPHQQQTESFPHALDIPPTATTTSNLSYAIVANQAKGGKIEARRGERSIERHPDPLGLNVIYAPEEGLPIVDIILVHGLGGTSQKTWSKNRDAQYFWPQKWLPLEPGFEQARVLSFGYNAHFASAGRENILNIADFAKDLLFALKYSLDHTSQGLEIGKAPIIFVAHSMGGLVVKKAFILSQNDNQYRRIMASATAILFLSTPHRGTDLAKLLNRILAVSLFNHSAKIYIAELKQNSPALQDINEQFRNIAPRLQIFSFFETHQTAVGPKKMMVLEKDSSILGYPDEVSTPLDADHHDVCKYSSPRDPNYVSIRNALGSIIRRVSKSENITCASATILVDMSSIKTLLAVSSSPEDDYEFFQSRRMLGSCEWILQRPTFLSWLKDDSNHIRIIRVYGVPGCGKSVLSAYLIELLQSLGHSCQFFFFREGDSAKKTVNSLLRSLAYQIAAQLPELRAQLQQLAEDAARLEKAESRVIWQKIFISRLCRLRLRKPLYWIVDALDECESPQLLLSLILSVTSMQIPLRIILTGRDTEVLSTALRRFETSILIDHVAADDVKVDLELYVAQEVRYMRGDRHLQTRIIQKVCEMAKGNFLWVHLVLKEILQCHTEAAIEQALEELPVELSQLYHRMEAILSRTSRSADRGLSRTILTWVVCSQRALTLEELSEALKPEFSHILDLQLTISQVCGNFIVIDNRSQVEMVHQTAREFLAKTPGLAHSVALGSGHQDLFMKCISSLSSLIRQRNGRPLIQPFVHYAATSWPYHLAHCAASLDNSVLLALARFFQSPHLFGWINSLASIDCLKTLVDASRSITLYLGMKSEIDAESSPLTHRLQEREIIELWAVDLVKIVGKFGVQMVKFPGIIYELVPMFCPVKTMISQQYQRNRARDSIAVTGFASQHWDDCLCKFSVGRDCQPLQITCMGRHFAILTSNGTLRLFDTITNQPWQKIHHGERVLCFKFSASYEKCATYGLRETKIWLVKQKRQLHTITNPIYAKALDVAFSSDESTLVSCSDDKSIRRCLLDSPNPGWLVVDGDRGFDGGDGSTYNSPRRVVFNPAGTEVAIAFRGFPLLVWDVEAAEILGRCERNSDRNKRMQDLYSEVGPVCWNPMTSHVLGLYQDGCIFKWHPLDSFSHEVRTVESGIQCNPDGVLFVTSNNDGMLKVWNFQHLTVVYQLSCHSPVIDVTLSANGRRVYDLRESFCNVWEPNALIRLAEADEKASETSSTMAGSTKLSVAAEGLVELSEPLTALGVAPRSTLYCSGDGNGVVRLGESNTEAVSQISQGFMPVVQIAWSHDEDYLVTADLGGRLIVRLRELPGDPDLAARYSSFFETKTGTGLRQILLSRSAEYMLIVTLSLVELWSLRTKSMISTRPNTLPFSRWISHPTEGHLLVQCCFTDIRLTRWSDLTEITQLQLKHRPFQMDIEPEDAPDPSKRPSTTFSMRPDETQDAIDEIILSNTGSHLILHMSSPSAQRQRTLTYLVVDIDHLATGSVSMGTTIIANELPGIITRNIARIVGFAKKSPRRAVYGPLSEAKLGSGDALIFLDRDDWVCSIIFGNPLSRDTKITRHFFLPQDWLNTDSLRLATISDDGRFLCPRHGEVAIVSNWLQNELVE